MRAAIYARISSDRVGAGLGVARQIEDCLALAERHGFEVVKTLEDNDISAWSGKPRPGYQALLESMRAGEVDAVLCWHTDRITRSARDLEDVIDACDRHEVTIHAVTAGILDLSTPMGQLQARIAGAVAKHESDQKAERIRRKHRELAETGRPASLGGSYGYHLDGTVNESQAIVIRDLVVRLLAGESLRSLTASLNERGIATTKGGDTWHASTVRAILSSGRICGWREWTPRRPATKEERSTWDGKPRRGWAMGPLVAEGAWEPIISREQTDQVRALLNDPARKDTKRRHYLLSAGILKCGRCGKTMNHKVDTRRNRVAARDSEGNVLRNEAGNIVRAVDPSAVPHSASRYACIKQSARGCGGISVSCPDVDYLVTEAIFAALGGVSLAPKPECPTDQELAKIRGKIAEAETLLVQVGIDHADGLIGRAEWLAMRQRLEANLDTLRLTLPRTGEHQILADLPTGGDDLRAFWPEMGLDRQRAVVQAVIDRVIVHPFSGPHGTPRFDPKRIEIVWRF